MKKFTAVIFDLFGTLVRDFSRHDYDVVYQHMARAVNAPLDDFRRAFGQSYQDRSVGVYDTIEQNITHVCAQLGLSRRQTPCNGPPHTDIRLFVIRSPRLKMCSMP
ncbi:hypothetical protein C2W62_02195 [Candidatus Entotheonella serta]|nr:hypothetical protein C2W62_02195 [Candidatus Entotheonella serta]